MPLASMRVLLDHAAQNDYGIVALNVNNMEQIQAIMEKALQEILTGKSMLLVTLLEIWIITPIVVKEIYF